MTHMMEQGGRQYLSVKDCTDKTPAELALGKGFVAIHDYLESERAIGLSGACQIERNDWINKANI